MVLDAFSPCESKSKQIGLHKVAIDLKFGGWLCLVLKFDDLVAIE